MGKIYIGNNLMADTNNTYFDAATLLNVLKTVDGGGSGLDADMVDTYESSNILKTMAALPSNANWDDYTENCIRTVNDVSGHTNSCGVSWGTLIVTKTNAGYTRQEFYRYDGASRYVRFRNETTWTAWKDALTENKAPADGWNPMPETWTYVSATSFSVPGDVRTKYQTGDKLSWYQNGTYRRSQIVAAPTYDAGTNKTTITKHGGYISSSGDCDILNTTTYPITGTFWSRVENPWGWQHKFFYNLNWHSGSGTAINIGNGSTTARFSIVGNMCNVSALVIGGSTTVWGDAGARWHWYLPVAPIVDTMFHFDIIDPGVYDYNLRSSVAFNVEQSETWLVGSRVSADYVVINGYIGSTYPITFGNGDRWSFNVSYMWM